MMTYIFTDDYLPEDLLRALEALCHLILSTMLLSRYYYYSHFPPEETEM